MEGSGLQRHFLLSNVQSETFTPARGKTNLCHWSFPHLLAGTSTKHGGRCAPGLDTCCFKFCRSFGSKRIPKLQAVCLVPIIPIFKIKTKLRTDTGMSSGIILQPVKMQMTMQTMLIHTTPSYCTRSRFRCRYASATATVLYMCKCAPSFALTSPRLSRHCALAILPAVW